jgi:siroheme synthase-like protein
VGGGQVGSRKVQNLLRAGAAVTVISPHVSKEVKDLAESGRIRWQETPYAEAVLEGAFLAVAATDDGELNGRVIRDAAERGVLACDASSASRSGVIFGALHRTEDVTVAVFTDGEDPSLARRTRDRIADLERDWEEK